MRILLASLRVLTSARGGHAVPRSYHAAPRGDHAAPRKQKPWKYSLIGLKASWGYVATSELVPIYVAFGSLSEIGLKG